MEYTTSALPFCMCAFSFDVLLLAIRVGKIIVKVRLILCKTRRKFEDYCPVLLLRHRLFGLHFVQLTYRCYLLYASSAIAHQITETEL